MLTLKHSVRSIVTAAWVLTIAVSLIPTSELFGQSHAFDIGTDQSKASRAETFAWLRERVPTLGTFVYEAHRKNPNVGPPGDPHNVGLPVYLPEIDQQTEVFRWIAVSGCDVQFEQRWFDPATEKGMVRSYKVSLREIDPMSFHVVTANYENEIVGIPTSELSFETKNTVRSIYSSATDMSSPHEPAKGFPGVPNNYGAEIEFRVEESAERVGRALKHAAILCGGKIDAF
jgi:hypothetical protein